MEKVIELNRDKYKCEFEDGRQKQKDLVLSISRRLDVTHITQRTFFNGCHLKYNSKRKH